MSYSHAADGKLAPALQSALHRFAKPWYRLRAIHVFRDKTSLSVNPALWPSIEKALSESEYFILLASPGAAASHWVQQEVDYWLKNGLAENILIVLTDGDAVWDDSATDFDWSRTTALPPNLRNVFREKPLRPDLRWVKKEENLSLRDPKFRNAVAELAAPLHGSSKDRIAREEARQHRKTMRLVWSAVMGLFTLMVIASAAAYYAIRQRNQAERRLGDSLMANAVQVATNDEWLKSRKLSAGAKELFIEQGRDTFEVDLEIFRGYYYAPPPLLSWVSSAPMQTFSPDRTHGLAIRGKKIELIDLKTMRVLGNFIVSPQEIVNVWFSPKGNLMLLEHSDHTLTVTLTVWHKKRPRPALKLPGHDDNLKSAAISTDGRLVVSTAEDNTTILWDLRSGKVLHELAKGRHVNAVAFTPDSESVLTGTRDGHLILWNTQTGEVTRSIATHTGTSPSYILSIAISKDGQYALSGGEAMILWDLKTGNALRRFSDAKPPIWEVAFSNDDRFVLATMGIQEPSVKVWFADTGILRYTFAGFGLSLQESAFSRHGVNLLHHDGKRNYLSAQVEERGLLYLKTKQGSIKRLEFSPDGRLLVSIAANGTHAVWDVATGYQLEPLPLNGRRITSVRFFPDSTKIAYSGDDGTVGTIDLHNRGNLINFQAHASAVVDLAISPDGKKALTVGADKIARLWDIGEGRRILSVELSEDPQNVSFVQGGMAGLIASSAGLWVWNLRTRELDLFAAERGATGWAFAVSRNGRVCTSGGQMPAAMKLHYWDLKRRQKIRALAGHTFGISQCDFSPDGAWLVSVGYDRTLRFWEAATGRQLPEVILGEGIQSVRFSPDGRDLAVGKSNGELQIWHLSRPTDYETFTPKVAQAVATLSKQPKHLESLELLARWYAFREIWTWSIELFEEVRQSGGDVSSLPLARAYWSLGRYDGGGREYQRALERKEAPPYYLRMCQRAIGFLKPSGQEQRHEK